MSLSSIGMGKNYWTAEDDPHTCKTSEDTKFKIILLSGTLGTVAGMGLAVAATTAQSLALALGGVGLIGAGIFTYMGGCAWYCRRDICHRRLDDEDDEENVAQLREIRIVAERSFDSSEPKSDSSS